MAQNRTTRLYQEVRAQLFRPRFIVALGLACLVTGWLLWQARGVSPYGANVALNVGSDLAVLIATIFIITPLISQVQRGQIREHSSLNYDSYTSKVRGATSSIQILDTFSTLLNRPQTRDFFRALNSALGQGATVQILLLDPDSRAASLRAGELDDTNFQQEILRNLRVLHEFAEQLQPTARPRFEVRLYSSVTPITLYRWDDKALISFLSPGRLSGQGTQLEITTDSTIGEFVEERFNGLWNGATKASDFMRLHVTLGDGQDGATRDYSLLYASISEVIYVSVDRIAARIARAQANGRAVPALNRQTGETFHLDLIDDEDPVHPHLIRHFGDKYGAEPGLFALLERVEPQLPPEPH